MPVRAAMTGKAGIHQTQTVQEFRSRTEGTADARNAGALVQCECGGNIQHLIHRRFGRLRHSPAGIGGKRFEITTRALGIQHTQRKGGFSRTRHARNSDDLSQRNIDINIFQVVDFRSTNQHFINHCFTPDTESPILSFRKRPAVNPSLCRKVSIPYGAVSC